MTSIVKQKEVFTPVLECGPFYTGGNVEWSTDGTHLLCQCGTSIKVLSLEDGSIKYSIPAETLEDDVDDILTFCVAADTDSLVTTHKSGLIKLWDWRNGELQKSWKSIHKGPITCMSISSADTGCLLATGGADSYVRLWILQHNSCTHNLKAAQGPVSIVKFHKNKLSEKLELFTAGDGYISVFDVSSGNCLHKLNEHFSRITDIDFDYVNNRLVSCGRDKVFITWDLTTYRRIKIIPLYESLETCSVFHLNQNKDDESEDDEDEESEDEDVPKLSKTTFVLTGGEKGILHYFDTNLVKELYLNNKFTSSVYKIIKYNNYYAIITTDHNVNIYKLNKDINNKNIINKSNKILKFKKQFVGYNDEILCMALLGDEETHLAVGANNKFIQLYNRKDMGCTLIHGHTDFVLSMATSISNRNLLLTGSKDNSIRLWLFDGKKNLTCVAVGSTHTERVLCVAISQLSSSFLVSGSQDTTIKLWKFPPKISSSEEQPLSLELKYTEIAHHKDINCVCVSPNDKLIVTGSQDKTIKLWNATDLKLLSILKGHKKGIWSLNFSPLDKVLISSSGDTTIKLWCLTDLVCLKTFEGHDASVLQCQFINKGTQIVSSGGDGLLKLWSIKTSTCVATFDKHASRIWCLAITKDENELFTGGMDSMIITWRDTTEQTVTERIAKLQEGILQTQQLDNLVNSNQLVKALKLALKLNRPHTTLKIVKNIIKENENELKSCILKLHEDERDELLKCAVEWNTNAKHSYPAQLILSVLLELQCNTTTRSFQNSLEGLIPYTQRHFHRLTQLDKDVRLLQYTTALMSLN